MKVEIRGVWALVAMGVVAALAVLLLSWVDIDAVNAYLNKPMRDASMRDMIMALIFVGVVLK